MPVAGRERPSADYTFSIWYGFLASAKTPRVVLQTLHDAVVEVGKGPQVAAKIRVQRITPASIGLKVFETYIRNDMQRLSPLLANIGQSKG